MTSLKSKIRVKFRQFGFDIVRFNLKKILAKQKVEVILDVGANDGKYGVLLRSIGYKGKIISFEPLKSAYQKLEKKANRDKNWTAKRFALGNANETSQINVSENSYSSSLLNMLSSHTDVAPDSRYITKEEIEVATLDSIINNLDIKGKSIMLKIDTQGFEKKVLEGASDSLSFINTVQLEMSLVNLYENETTFTDMHLYLSKFGFRLVDIEQGFVDETHGMVLQIDGTYIRN